MGMIVPKPNGATMKTKELSEKWREEYENLKDNLITFNKDLSEQRNLMEYNILTTQALQLMECRIDLEACNE